MYKIDLAVNRQVKIRASLDCDHGLCYRFPYVFPFDLSTIDCDAKSNY